MTLTAKLRLWTKGLTMAAFGSFLSIQVNAQGAGAAFEHGPDMMRAKIFPTATVLPDGKIITFSGRELNFVSCMYSDLYNPETNTFTETQMNYPHDASATVKMSDGRYFLLGGGQNLGVAPGYATTEIYNPASETFEPKASMTRERMQLAAVQLNDGKILVAGAWFNQAGAVTGEVYDPASNTFTATGPMSDPRSQANIFPATDGGAVVFGGWPSSGGSVKTTTEYYSASNNTFTGFYSEIIPADPGWIPASITTRPFADCKLNNGKYIFMAYRSNGGTEYALITFDPATKQFAKVNTGSALINEYTDGGFADFVLNKGHNLVYLIGTDAGFDPQRIAITTVNLSTGEVFHPSGSFELPAQEYFYASYTFMPASGKILVLGINGSTSGYFTATSKTFLLTPEITLSTENEEKNPAQVSVYPNPAREQITVRLPSSFSGNCHLRLIDNQGKLCLNQNVDSDSRTISLKTTGMRPGLYLLSLNSEGKSRTEKLIISD